MLDALLRPRSVAVVGASRTPNTIGYQILDNLVRHGFTGAVYPVNPSAASVHSIKAYPSVEAIPEPVDLAVVVVPKQHVQAVAEACGRKGVGAMVVISAGFREIGGAGVERERALVETVRKHGMRLVGPNCMGVMNTEPGVSMNATFAPTMPPAGPGAFMSQSGAMGVTILDYAAEYGIGISQFVSVGNKADVSGNDLVAHWADAAQTRVILMYLENFGNPRRFTRLAREITKTKPII
ncbi:MAG TPA: CoA-binding protein, partial [Longimicrobiaceae bacterium]|nr:CoA-binding protein [Longimicrobiaceae bacterium]